MIEARPIIMSELSRSLFIKGAGAYLLSVPEFNNELSRSLFIKGAEYIY